MDVRFLNTRRLFPAIILVFGLLGIITGMARAEDGEGKLGNWIGANSALRYSDKWSLFLQGELRTWEMASYLMVRFAIWAGWKIVSSSMCETICETWHWLANST